jgi:hypothetical protein
MPNQTPLTAGLAKRLAEAADGYRDNKYYYFVCRLEFPFDLQVASADNDAEANSIANAIRDALNDGAPDPSYYVYGPYKTPSEYTPPYVYDQIEVKFLNQGTDAHCETLTGDTDAIILNLSAFDKFFLPYYTRLYGATEAYNMRKLAKDVFSGNAESEDGIQSPIAQSILVTHKNRTYSLI